MKNWWNWLKVVQRMKVLWSRLGEQGWISMNDCLPLSSSLFLFLLLPLSSSSFHTGMCSTWTHDSSLPAFGSGSSRSLYRYPSSAWLGRICSFLCCRPTATWSQTNTCFKPGVKEVLCARCRDAFTGNKKGLACGLKNRTVDLQPYNKPTEADSSALGRLIP